MAVAVILQSVCYVPTTLPNIMHALLYVILESVCPFPTLLPKLAKYMYFLKGYFASETERLDKVSHELTYIAANVDHTHTHTQTHLERQTGTERLCLQSVDLFRTICPSYMCPDCEDSEQEELTRAGGPEFSPHIRHTS